MANLSGVSVRTLHHYDRIGLLKPAVRTESKYRLYGENELLRLQQIIFYKEMDLSLKEISEILDKPGFKMIQALKTHKDALIAKKYRMEQLIVTIDKTINKIKNNEVMAQPEELYEGLNKEKMLKYRDEAIDKFGKEAIDHAESELMKMSKTDFAQLKEEADENFRCLYLLKEEDPESELVQNEINLHYQIIRKFWGTSGTTDKQAEAYAGLGQLYVTDERYTTMEGKPQPEFAAFLCKAMDYYATHHLK